MEFENKQYLIYI